MTNDKIKQKLNGFFVVTGNRPSILGMPDMELLDILSIQCNTMEFHSNSGR